MNRFARRILPLLADVRLAMAVLGTLAVTLLASLGRSDTPNDGAVVTQILTELEHGPPDRAALVKEPVLEAKRAQSRAAAARGAGDVKHADELDGLAREWAETARDLVRATQGEADAGALELLAADASLQAERARALLEGSLARRGEAAHELEELRAPDAGTTRAKPGAAEGGGKIGKSRGADTKTPKASPDAGKPSPEAP